MLLFLDDRGRLTVSEASPTVCDVTRNDADVTVGERANQPPVEFLRGQAAGLK